jgi:hypothetical protein
MMLVLYFFVERGQKRIIYNGFLWSAQDFSKSGFFKTNALKKKWRARQESNP